MGTIKKIYEAWSNEERKSSAGPSGPAQLQPHLERIEATSNGVPSESGTSRQSSPPQCRLSSDALEFHWIMKKLTPILEQCNLPSRGPEDPPCGHTLMLLHRHFRVPA
jgi:hypothetical protein